MQEKVGLVGLGYVGLPLAVAFAENGRVVGFDVKKARIDELRSGQDHTNEVDPAELKNPNLRFTDDPKELEECTFIIVAVPTPIDANRDPDLTPVIKSSETVGRILRKGMMVVYESTVYPGVTEDVCLPILERESGLKLGEFALGYSPERINPGDREHTVKKITKVVSGHDPAALDRCAATYGSVITAGVFRAANIKTAEAAKVIENVQRDLNIALMNELSKIFARIGIHTNDVLAAAGTKWNFHKYHPGLVGGHCIGVDPYYLTKRAQELGYEPEVILSGRRINDGMGAYVANELIFLLNDAGILPRNARVWVMGLTFKENVPDCRNSRAVDVIRELRRHGCKVSGWEPLIGDAEVKRRFDVDNVPFDALTPVDGVVLINGHSEFRSVTLASLAAKLRQPVLFDVKNFFSREEARRLGFYYKTL